MELSNKTYWLCWRSDCLHSGSNSNTSLPTSRSSFWGQAEPVKEAVHLPGTPKSFGAGSHESKKTTWEEACSQGVTLEPLSEGRSSNPSSIRGPFRPRQPSLNGM